MRFANKRRRTDAESGAEVPLRPVTVHARGHRGELLSNVVDRRRMIRRLPQVDGQLTE
jgi:hypothetical protein